MKRYEFAYVDDFGNEHPASERLEVDGEYVRFEDLDAALSREAELQAENDRLNLLVKDFQWGASLEAEASDEARTELAALREELSDREADIKAHAGRRVAAEQRNAEFVILVERMIAADKVLELWTSNEIAVEAESEFQEAFDALKAALKPTESGAGE